MVETFFSALAGIPTTLKITIITLIISAPIGFFMALARLKKKGLSCKIIGLYVSFIRGTPVVLQILFFYSLLPSLLNYLLKNVLNTNINIFDVDPIMYAYIVFSLNTVAVLSEVFRSALSTVGHGQMEAALSVGLSGRQAYTRIIIPQALVSAVPNICNTTISLLKSTSLAYMMTVKDIMAIAKMKAAYGYNYIEAYLVVFFIYILLCTAVQLLFKVVENYLASYKKLITE
jgi:L-cystine transport system permease protein